MNVSAKMAYGAKWLPVYFLQRLRRRAPSGTVHLIIALADHFEPSAMPGGSGDHAPYDVQQQRLDAWCRDYPKAVGQWRDSGDNPFRHTYFYPAEQYDKSLIERLAQHCSTGWGEIEIHLHHGLSAPDTAEDTSKQLLTFRDVLSEHGCLSYMDGEGPPRYAFVHGNFALANSAGGVNCGVDGEIQVLADTGCYADFTLPTAPFHPAQTAKINSLYECDLPLSRRMAHKQGHNLQVGSRPQVFPLMVQGPLLPDVNPHSARTVGIENGALTKPNPASLHRLHLWKRAAIGVKGRPDWLFIKLHCHSMDPTQADAVIGASMQKFVRELVEGAPQRNEVLHFATAREMVNIILAACDGREGNPEDFRDYRLKRNRLRSSIPSVNEQIPHTLVEG